MTRVHSHIAYAPRWSLVLPVAVVGSGCAVLVAVVARQVSTAESLLPAVRASSILIAVAATTLSDERSQLLIDTSPVGRWRSTAVALAIGLALAWAAWVPTVLIARTAPGGDRWLPPIGLSVELVGLIATGWAITLASARANGGERRPAFAGAMLVLLAGASLSVPQAIHWLWVGPGPAWQRSHIRWGAVALVSLTVCALAASDPAHRWRSYRHREPKPAESATVWT